LAKQILKEYGASIAVANVVITDLAARENFTRYLCFVLLKYYKRTLIVCRLLQALRPLNPQLLLSISKHQFMCKAESNLWSNPKY